MNLNEEECTEDICDVMDWLADDMTEVEYIDCNSVSMDEI